MTANIPSLTATLKGISCVFTPFQLIIFEQCLTNVNLNSIDLHGLWKFPRRDTGKSDVGDEHRS